MTDLLTATGLTKGYGRIPVLKRVDLAVADGEVHVVIGPNGAGKSTLLKVISGEILVEQGRITFDGRDVTGLPDHRRVHLGFGRTFQVAHVFLGMTAWENMVVAVEAMRRRGVGRTRLLGLHPTSSVKAAVQALLEETGLHRVASRLAGVLSHGDRKRLELAMALASRPRLLLLDEPTAGMSPEDRAASIRLLGRVTRDRGMSLLLTEHDMGVVFGLGTRLTVLNYGEVIATGMPEEVRRNPLVQEVYLGQNTNAA